MTASALTRQIAVGTAVRFGGYIRTVSGICAGTLDLVDSEGNLVAVVGERQVVPLVTIVIPAKECCGELLGEMCDCQRAALLTIEANDAPTVVVSW